jgi:DNA (cytosine-5)-methyltransferase 1
MGSASVIDCFCGAGGLSLGFKNVGFQLIYSFDNDKASVETYKHNIDSHAWIEDVKYVSKLSIEDKIGASLENLEGIIGGPPCQGFSVQRRGSNEDPRNQLVNEFVRLALEIKPRFFLMENVQGLLSTRGLPYFNALNEKCSKAGYYMHTGKLNALDFGVPQNRKRVFVLGELVKGGLTRFSLPSPPVHKKVPTVRDAIFDLMRKTEEDVPNHRADKLSPINLRRIRSIKQGQGRDSLPPDLQLKTHLKNTKHRHLDVYGRMSWDAPSPTITARFDSFSRGRFGHPQLDRTITLREGARLQSFPDDFVFEGTKVEVARQIGNAVPPLLATALAKQVRLCLEA